MDEKRGPAPQGRRQPTVAATQVHNKTALETGTVKDISGLGSLRRRRRVGTEAEPQPNRNRQQTQPHVHDAVSSLLHNGRI
jgi:hypothetical protein